MPAGNSVTYYLRREQDARKLAANAVDAAIAKIHLELAEQYAQHAAAAKRGENVKLHLARR